MFLLIVLVLLWVVYKWSVENFDYFEKIGIPFEKPMPLLGNMWTLVSQKESLVDLTRASYEKYKNSKIFGFFNFKEPMFYVTDPELIRQITIKDFDHFQNHNGAFTAVDKIFDKSLFALNDKPWRDMRSTLSPIFTSSKMKMMYELLSKHVDEFVNFFAEKAERGETEKVKVIEVFKRFTVDGISTAALGFEADCVVNKNSEIFKLAMKILEDFTGPKGNLKFLFAYTFTRLYKFLGIQAMSQEVYDFFKRAVIDTMNDREKNGATRPDVIQLLLQARKGQLKYEKEANEKELSNFAANIEYETENKNKSFQNFTDDDWIAQGWLFFGAGFDTTSFFLQMTSYELSKNPKIQEKLQQAIDEADAKLDGKPISYEDLHKIKYLDMVVSESLRKWTPGPITDRSCSKDYLMNLGNGRTIPIKKNQIINFPIYHIHNDPEYFPNPEKFDPERFSDENKNLIQPGTYFPFGSGPRTCIGSRYALMEVKLLLFNFLRRFSVETCRDTPEKVKYTPSLVAKIHEDIHLKFKLRK